MAITSLTGFAAVPKILIKLTKDVGSVTNASSLDVDFTVPGCTTGDTGIIVPVTVPTTGLIWSTGWCATAGTMTFRVANVTGSPIDPASGDYYIMVL